MASQHMLGRVQWHQTNGNEWFFVGERGDFKESTVQSHISEIFSEAEVFLVRDRHEAFVVLKENAAAMVKDNLGSKDVTLVSKDFRTFFHFSHVGVARHGIVS